MSLKEKFWQDDFISDEIMDEEPQKSHILTITGATTSDSDLSGVLSLN